MGRKRNSFYKFIFIIIFGVFATIFGYDEILEPRIPASQADFKEKDYVNAFCKGQIEYILPDKTRIDCMTYEYAIEFDWAKKWAEGIGQALYYSEMTGKKPAVALILTSPQDEKYVQRIKIAQKNLKVFEIKAYLPIEKQPPLF